MKALVCLLGCLPDSFQDLLINEQGLFLSLKEGEIQMNPSERLGTISYGEVIDPGSKLSRPRTAFEALGPTSCRPTIEGGQTLEDHVIGLRRIGIKNPITVYPLDKEINDRLAEVRKTNPQSRIELKVKPAEGDGPIIIYPDIVTTEIVQTETVANHRKGTPSGSAFAPGKPLNRKTIFNS